MPKNCDKCGMEVHGSRYFLIEGKLDVTHHKYQKNYCLSCAQLLQLVSMAEDMEGTDLNGDDTPEGIKKLAAPVKLTHIHKPIKWMKKGVGPTEGGNRFATVEFGDREFDLYMDNTGIYGTRDYPAYFYDNAGNWYRVNCNHIKILPI